MVHRPPAEKIDEQSDRLSQVILNAPVPLKPILREVLAVIQEAGINGIQTHQSQLKVVDGAGGKWQIRHLIDFRSPWVAIQWPLKTNRSLILWLTKTAYAARLATERPEVPENQLWIYLGR